MDSLWANKVFHIRKHGELLAIIDACRPSVEMFWLTCHLHPMPSFDEVEPLYRRLSEADVDMKETTHIDEALIAMGVVLVDVEADIEIKYFSFFYQPDGTITLRYAEPPYLTG